MAKSIDRRASKLEDGEERVPLTIDVEKAAGVQRHKDGSIRRITPGIRSLGDFFDAEQADRPLTRGDMVNVLSSLEHNRRESRWYRRIVRFFRHYPQVPDLMGNMAAAHAQGLENIKRELQDQVAHAAKAAQAFQAGAKAAK